MTSATMSVLGFVLACAATAAVVGTAVALLVAPLVALIAKARRYLNAAVRADLVLLAGIFPALAAVTTVAGAAAPSFESLLGLSQDHCPAHAHEFHICFVHSSALPPALATVGAFALLIGIYRAGALVKGLLQTRAEVRSLEAIGRRTPGVFPTFVLPGSKLCHAVGLWRRRIILSAELEANLSEDELASALAHEASHLQRRDPLASFVLSVAGVFIPPAIAACFRRWQREAAEEACDAAAAAAMGDGTLVAAALLKVAGLQRGYSGMNLAAPAFGDHPLEIRVRTLLGNEGFVDRPARWPVVTLVAVASLVALTFSGFETLHHGVEHFLGSLF